MGRDGRIAAVGATVGVLLPVKSFAVAKARLAAVLDGPGREALARSLAERTLRAAHELPVTVVCDDRDVARWARSRGAAVVADPGGGLSSAVRAGVAYMEGAGLGSVIVAHADLPWAEDLRPVAGFDGVTLVPDRHEDGTNVICVPAGCGFDFSYGPGSFARHRAAATRTGRPVRIMRDAALAWDVDEPADLPAGEAFGAVRHL
ncbi:MAG TPA: 2-phospho-L-lactate guanylyltransferase [Acidimicrobiales bacterium]